MARSFKTQLAGQIGESVVVAELGRRGIVATAFAGNVPDIDIVAYADGATTHLQVKTWRTGDVQFDGKRFLRIEFEGDRQHLLGVDDTLDGSLIYVFVLVGELAGRDRFFIITQRELQQIIFDNYGAWLTKHGGIRPRNPKTTHVAVRLGSLEKYEDNWTLIEQRLQ